MKHNGEVRGHEALRAEGSGSTAVFGGTGQRR